MIQAAAAPSTAVPPTHPPEPKVPGWPEAVALVSSFSPSWAAAAVRAQENGYTALGFLEEVLDKRYAPYVGWGEA